MTQTLSAAEYRNLSAIPKNKYNAKRTTLDGITFASKAEANYYAGLKLREKAGEVAGVELQRRFALLGPDGALISVYVADFCFWDHVADRFRCIDVKGIETPAFKMKRKMMKSFLQIDVEVIK